jgi:hypothetical protein
MSRENVNPYFKFGDSDGFMLTDLDTHESLMMIPCDTAGNFSWTGATRAPLQRNAMQTSNTSNQYSDLEPPWISIPQENWTGGRGNAIFTKDTTRYLDGKRCQAAFNEVIYNAPLDYYSTGFREAVTNCPGSLSWKSLTSEKHIAVAFDLNAPLSAGEVYIHLRRRGTPTSGLLVELTEGLADGSTVLASHEYTTDEITDTLAEFKKFTFPTQALSTQTYYIRVSAADGDADNYWQVGTSKTYQLSTFESPDGVTWTPSNYELYYRIAEPQTGKRCRFFMYEQLQFMIRQDEQDNPSLWLNGEIGKSTGATEPTLTDSTKTWAVNQWAGARIGLVYRNGSEGHVSVWRKIVSNTADTITVDQVWDITPADVTYIIVDTPLWTEITGHGLTAYVTDIHVIKGVVYFCQGDYVNVRKMRWEDGAFEWQELNFQASYLQSVRDTNGMMLYRARNDDENHKRSVERSILLDWETEPTEVCNRTSAITTDGGTKYSDSVDFGKCDYDMLLYKVTIGTFSSSKNVGRIIITLQESEDNSAFTDVQSVTADSAGIWYISAHCQYRYRRIKFAPSGTDCSVNNINVTTDSNPRWVDKITLLDNYGKITRLFEYGAESEKSLWISQEGMLSSINKVDGQEDTYTHDRINLDELQTTAEEWNAKAMQTGDVYILWAWLNGLQRYYNTQLEGKGPDHDEGLPFERQGRVTQIVSYPSNFFISIDGEDGYSCVMMFNQSGWHEIYRAPNPGERIYDMGFQPIYGTRPDRLWIQVGDDVIWLAMPSKILYAIQDRNAEYTHESVLVSSWHTAGMTDVEKLWQSMKIMADYLDGENCWIEADYQVDEEETWHPIENWYTVSPSQKEDLNPNGSVNGKKLRYRLRLQTTDYHKTPKVNVVVLEAVGRVDIKMSYTFYFRNIKYKRDLNADFEDIEPLDVQNLLDEWANKLKKLRLNSRWLIYDNKIVYLDAVQTSIVNELSEGYIAQITLNEL